MSQKAEYKLPGAGGGLLHDEYRVSVWDGGKVLEVDCGDVAQLNSPELYT